MPKSTTADKLKSKGKGKQAQPPSPAPPSSRSGSPSSSSASPSDSSDDDDSSASGSARSSASPEAEAPKKPERVVDPSLRKYTPPSGFKPLKATVDKGALDWDDLRDDHELELWAVRIPVGLKTKHLDGLTLTLPPRELGTPSQPVGHLSAKKAQYDAFLTVPPASSSTKRKRGEAAPEEAEGAGATAGELAAAVPLVPRKSHGNKLFQAPRPIARTLTLQRALPAGVLTNPTTAHLLKTSHSSLIASQPSPVPGSILDADALLLEPAEIAHRKEAVRGKGARDQPDELLRFRLGNFGGMGPEGGKGRYHNPMERVVRTERVEIGDDEGVRAAEGEGDDVEMADAVAGDDKKKVKKERKDKKERRKSEAAAAAVEGGDAESPRKKKKKVKAEE
ncbi:hypothetical protein JCM8208_001816 [Rhodotorula glutinis]